MWSVMKLYTPLGHTCYFGDSGFMSNLVPITAAATGSTLSEGQ